MNQALLEKFGRSYEKDDIIFCEFEDGKECFVIHEGDVAIMKISEGIEKTLTVLHPGDIFGEMGVLEGKPRTATAIAVTPVTVLALDINGLQALVQSQPDFAFKLGKILGSRIVESYRHLHNLTIDNPKLRVVDILLWKSKEQMPNQYYTPLSPEEIAEFGGLPMEEVDRVLKEFVQLGRLRISSNRVDILDIRSLKRLLRPGQ